MNFVYGRDKMTDKEKLSMRKHPDYPGVWFESRIDSKSGYEYFEALNPEDAAAWGLRATYYEFVSAHKHFVENLVPVYKVVLAE